MHRLYDSINKTFDKKKKRRAVIFNQGGLALFLLFPETLKKQLPPFEIYMVQFVHSTYSFLSLLNAMCLSDN